MMGATWETLDRTFASQHSEDLTSARAVRAQLVDRFRQLPTESQIVVNLFFCCDMGLDQIAEVLEVSSLELQELWGETLHHLCTARFECQEGSHG